MLKRFLKDSALYGVTGFLSRAVGLILLPLYTRVLSPTEYGMVDLILVARAFVAVTLALEIVQGLVRLLPEAEDGAAKRGLASTALWFTVGAYAVFTAAVFVFAAPAAAWLLGSAAHAGVVRVGAVYVATAGVLTLLQELLRFELKPRWYTASSLSGVAVTGAVTVALLLTTPLRVEAVLWGLVVGNVVGIMIAAPGARSRLGAVFSARQCREMLAFSIPLVVSGAAVMVSMFVDRIVIRSLMTVADVGVYGVAARLASPLTVGMSVVQMALIPIVYNNYGAPDTARGIARITRLVAVMICPGILLLGVFAPEIIRVVATSHYLGAAPVIPALALSIVLAQMWVFAPGLGLGKRTRTIAALNVAGAVVNLALNLLLVPRLGIMGAAVSTLTGSAFTAAGYVLLGRAWYPVPHPWGRIGVGAGVCAAALALAWAAWHGAPVTHPAAWAAKGALCAAAAAATAALLVEPGELHALRGVFRAARGRSAAGSEAGA